jgi:hypothetical protein
MLKYGGAIKSRPVDLFIGRHPRPSISKEPTEIDLAVYSWRSARVLARSRSGQARAGLSCDLCPTGGQPSISTMIG